MASIFRLAPQTRRTSGPGYTGWRTPATSEPGVSLERLQTKEGDPWTPGQRAYDKETGRVAQVGLTHEIQATWPSPTAMDTMDREGMRPSRAATNRTTGYLSEAVVTYASTWPTPATRDYKGGYQGGRLRNGRISNDTLDVTVQHTAATTWPTPTANNYEGDTPENLLTRRAAMKEKHNNGNGFGLTLGQMATLSGTTPSGLTAPTEKRGALNPTFVCWLMGFPPEWESCAPTVMPSSRRSRQK